MNMRPLNLVWRPIALMLLPGAFVCLTGCAGSRADLTIRDEWDVMSLTGVQIGYDHTITRRTAGPEPEIVTSTFSETRIKDFGATLVTHEVEEDYESPEGALLRVTYSVTGAQTSDSEARIEGGKVIVTTHTGGTTHVAEIAWDPEVLGPEAQMRRLRESGFPIGKGITFREYVREMNRIVTSTITIQGSEMLMIAGKPRRLYKATEVNDGLPGVVEHLWLDETGDALKCVMDDGFEEVLATREEALAAVTSPNQADLAGLSIFASNVKFDQPDHVAEALYRIEGAIGNLKVEDRRQKVEDQGPGWVLLRVKALGDAPVPSAEKPGPEYLAASAYLQSDDPDIQRMARDNVAPSASPAMKAKQLAEWVSKYITKKDYNVGFASAKETLLSREGDCKEHSLLLAALLRAAGIPSRVVVGLTYADGLFIGHMWTEAYLNDWTALDATLMGGNVVDATHIKLAASAMAGPTADDAALVLEAQAEVNLKIRVQEFKEGALPVLGAGRPAATDFAHAVPEH
jgi:transglutaminase-like putative cysteine protease